MVNKFWAVLRKLWNASVSRVFGAPRGELNSDSLSSQSTSGGPAPTNISSTPALARNAVRLQAQGSAGIELPSRPRHGPLPKLLIGPRPERGGWEEQYKPLSPPLYSPPNVFTSKPTLPSPAGEDTNHGEYHELEPYNGIDVEHKTFIQHIELSLEEFFHGKHILYGFTKKLVRGATLRQTLDVVIPPGCPEGTVYRFSDVGHELAEDVFQDIHLLFVEKPHPLGFKRTGPDISTSLCLPWTESLEEGPRRFSVTGIDGKKYTVEIDYRFSKMVDGSVTFYESGMPMPDGRGRGKFIVNWQIYSPSSPCED